MKVEVRSRDYCWSCGLNLELQKVKVRAAPTQKLKTPVKK
jgi:hypothetical protein